MRGIKIIMSIGGLVIMVFRIIWNGMFEIFRNLSQLEKEKDKSFLVTSNYYTIYCLIIAIVMYFFFWKYGVTYVENTVVKLRGL